MRRKVKLEENRRISSWRFSFIFLLVVLAAVQIFVHYPYYENELLNLLGGKQTDDQIRKINESVFQVLDEYGIQPNWMKRENNWWIVDVPRDLSTTRIYVDIISRASELGAGLKQGEENYATGEVQIVLTYRNRSIIQLSLKKGEQEAYLAGYVALIIDDFGYSKGGLLQKVLNLPHDMTFAVIPGLEHSTEIAQLADEHHKEIIVHLPMEALEEEVEDRGYTILVNQSKLEIRDRIRKALRAIPNAKGINNHQGSRATADEAVMSVLMTELSRSGYYYIDSRTTAKSVGVKLASRAKVPTLSNQLFLDVDPDIETIRKQVQKLEELARQHEKVVAIGHFREITINVLKEELPLLEKRGVRFVTVSELLEK